MIDSLAKALINPLTTLAKDQFKKKRLKRSIDKAVHETFSTHTNICLPLCMDEEFSPKLFRSAQGYSIDVKELVGLAITISRERGYGFSESCAVVPYVIFYFFYNNFSKFGPNFYYISLFYV